MFKKIAYISDFFLVDHTGGAEFVDNTIINFLKGKVDLTSIRSQEVTKNKLDEFDFFILSNLSLLDHSLVPYLCTKKYMIIEHDFKFLRGRNIPIWDVIVKEPKINIFVDLYKNAKVTFLQTKFHQLVFEQNNIISNFYNLDCSVWSEQELDLFDSVLLSTKKEKDICVVNSSSFIKGTQQAIDFCKNNNIKFELISNSNYLEFIKSLRKYNTLIFFPILAETCSRLAVEARCMGCNVVSWYKFGATDSDWFSLKEKDLISYLRKKSFENLNSIYCNL